MEAQGRQHGQGNRQQKGAHVRITGSLRVFICLFVFATTWASVGSVGSAQERAAAPNPANAQRTLVFIPKSTNSAFWLSIYAGAQQAAKELGYKEVMFKGMPSQTEIAGQVNLVNDMVARKVNGILVAATDAKALANPVEKAIAAGVPVVTVNSGVLSDKPYAHVATNNVEAASTAADTLAKLIGEKGIVGDIGLTAGSQTGIEREEGFVKRMAEKYPNIKVLPVQYASGDVATALNIGSDILTGNPNLSAFYCSNDAIGTGIAQLMKQRGVKEKIKVVAFDASPDEFKLFMDGLLDALIVQDPFMQGYRGVYVLDQVINGKSLAQKLYPTPAKVVTKANLNTPEIYDLLTRDDTLKGILKDRKVERGK